MTVTINPSPWYTALNGYKQWEFDYAEVLAAVAFHFLATHKDRIRAQLGGEPDILTIVPSKKGFTFDRQRLTQALSLIEPIRDHLVQTLRHSAPSRPRDNKYHPDDFDAHGESVNGKRVLLIEDTWVSGATAVSAAGRLVELGAASVVILPIARRVELAKWGDEHPYILDARRDGLDRNSLAVEWPR